MTIKKMLLSSEELQIAGQTTLSASQTWIVPDEVYSISFMGVAPGQPGITPGSGSGVVPGGVGGVGGNVRYINAVNVYPGQAFQFALSSSGFSVTSNGGTLLTDVAGGVSIGRAGDGQVGGAGFPGTGGGPVGGNGALGGFARSISSPGQLVPGTGGTVGQTSGFNTSGGNGGAGQFPGGGGGGGGGGVVSGTGGPGGGGCLRIIWPGSARSFPLTRTADEVSGEIAWSLVPHPEGSIPGACGGLCTDGLGTWLMLPVLNSSGMSYFLSADNGKSFQARTFNVGTAATYLSCVRAGDVFIVTTSLGTILRSADGITWTLVTVMAGQRVLTSTYSEGVLVIGLQNRTLRRSLDKGLTFSAATASFSGLPSQSASGNGVYLIGDSTGNPKRSSDGGATFAEMASGLFPNSGVNLIPTFSDNRFMGTRAGSTIAYVGNSDASVAFTASTVPGSGTLNKVTHLAGRYFAAGTLSRFMEMKDSATNWAIPSTLTNNLVDTLISISQIEGDGYGVILVIGSQGLIMRGELK